MFCAILIIFMGVYIYICSFVVSFILFDPSYFLSAMFIAVGCRPESFGVHSDDQEKNKYIRMKS